MDELFERLRRAACTTKHPVSVQNDTTTLSASLRSSFQRPAECDALFFPASQERFDAEFVLERFSAEMFRPGELLTREANDWLENQQAIAFTAKGFIEKSRRYCEKGVVNVASAHSIPWRAQPLHQLTDTPVFQDPHVDYVYSDRFTPLLIGRPYDHEVDRSLLVTVLPTEFSWAVPEESTVEQCSMVRLYSVEAMGFRGVNLPSTQYTETISKAPKSIATEVSLNQRISPVYANRTHSVSRYEGGYSLAKSSECRQACKQLSKAVTDVYVLKFRAFFNEEILSNVHVCFHTDLCFGILPNGKLAAISLIYAEAPDYWRFPGGYPHFEQSFFRDWLR